MPTIRLIKKSISQIQREKNEVKNQESQIQHQESKKEINKEVKNTTFKSTLNDLTPTHKPKISLPAVEKATAFLQTILLYAPIIVSHLCVLISISTIRSVKKSGSLIHTQQSQTHSQARNSTFSFGRSCTEHEAFFDVGDFLFFHYTIIFTSHLPRYNSSITFKYWWNCSHCLSLTTTRFHRKLR